MSFSRPKMPPPAPLPVPVIEDTDAKAQEYAAMLAKRKGRAAAILTDRKADQTPTTAAKVLLGG